MRQSISLSAEEALQQKVIDFIAPTQSSVFAYLSGHTVNGVSVSESQPIFQPVGMTFIEALLHGAVDPNIAFILFLLGLVGIIFEILHPGIRLPGVLGVLAFLVSLVLLGLLPVNIAGVVLLVAGVIFLAFEVHLHTFGAAATLGIALLVLGGLFLFNSSVPNAQVSKWLVIGMAVALGAFFTLVVRAVVQSRKQLPSPAKLHDIVGTEAVVVRALDPSGVVRARGEQGRVPFERRRLKGGSAMEKRFGVVSSDGHSVAALSYLDLAVSQARRAWLTKGQVLNTRSWAQVAKLRKKRP